MNWYKLSAGSISEKENFTEKDADPQELKMGIEIEKEHTKDEDKARKIALDHLAEIPDYYSRLKKMESGAKGMSPPKTSQK